MGGNYYSKLFFNEDVNKEDLINNLKYQPPTLNKIQNDLILNKPNVKHFMIPMDDDNDISVLQISPKFTTLKIIIFVHDYYSNIFTIYKYLDNLSTKLGITICSFDYPQYGWSSDGPCNKHTCLQSLQAVIHYYLKRYYKITIVSVSFASDIVIDYVTNSKNQWKLPIALLAPAYLDTNLTAIINKILCKVKLIHGLNDEITPIEKSQEFSQKLESKKKDRNLQPKWIPYCGHFDLLDKIIADDFLDVING